jgi:hypothetical protein
MIPASPHRCEKCNEHGPPFNPETEKDSCVDEFLTSDIRRETVRGRENQCGQRPDPDAPRPKRLATPLSSSGSFGFYQPEGM